MLTRSTMPWSRLTGRMRKLRRSEKGGVVAVTAITLPVILLISALCVDVGLLYLAKSRAEATALYAAEAGLERMPDQVEAASLAQNVGASLLNDSQLISRRNVDVTTTSTTITVEVEIVVKAIFARFAGETAMTAAARITRSL